MMRSRLSSAELAKFQFHLRIRRDVFVEISLVA